MCKISLLSVWLLFSVALIACGNNANSTKKPSPDSTAAVVGKFKVLQFMANDKPCSASINTQYQHFETKKLYPLSVFITIQKSNKQAVDSLQYYKLEKEILKSTSTLSICYIGNTNMGSYRDMIFYIKPQDQKLFTAAMTAIKGKYPEVKNYVFETDPEWEAVSEFYTALN